MITTLLTLGWAGDFHKLKKAACRKYSFLGRICYKLYTIKHRCYVYKDCMLADDVVFPHFSGIHIACATVIGSGCVIHQNVTIGSNYIKGTKYPGAPVIGNNVFIGANACIIGGVKIGDNVRIGAGCVVVEDIPSDSIVVMNKPRIIKKDV
ncbi:MAG: serine acetyltransferase [Bacteroidales bacterium]|nr:serine acetyltransferase [Bacteroidales bacterium]